MLLLAEGTRKDRERERPEEPWPPGSTKDEDGMGTQASFTEEAGTCSVSARTVKCWGHDGEQDRTKPTSEWKRQGERHRQEGTHLRG